MCTSPGTVPPRNPSFSAVVSSWMLPSPYLAAQLRASQRGPSIIFFIIIPGPKIFARFWARLNDSEICGDIKLVFYVYIKMEYNDKVFVPTCVGNMSAAGAGGRMQLVISHLSRKK